MSNNEKEIIRTNHVLARTFQQLAEMYLSPNTAVDDEKLHRDMTVLVPKTYDMGMRTVITASHSSSRDERIRGILKGKNLPLAVVLTGVTSALRQIVENGSEIIPIDMAIEIANYTENRLKRAGKKLENGHLWAHGYREACSWALTQPDMYPE